MSDKSSASIFRAIFGIIMILIYVGMGALILSGWFGWFAGSWLWLRYTAGILLIIYGIWRAYRQFAGVDSPI